MIKKNNFLSTNGQGFSGFVLVIIAGVCASMLMFWITAYDPGVGPDSVEYIETARNLLAGNGFYTGNKPLTQFPPGYPFILAVAGFFYNGDVLYAGRLVCSILFGVNVALLGLAVLLCTERSFSATVCAIFLFMSSTPILLVHSLAQSEAPFIMFMISAFILVSLYVLRPRSHLLFAVSVCAACAILTRYIGVALLPPIVCILLFLGDRSMKQKIKDSVIFAVIALLPLVLWLVRNVMIAEATTGRSFAVHSLGFQHVKQLVATMNIFVFPVSTPDWSKALYIGFASVLFLISIIFLYKKNYIRNNKHTVRVAFPFLCILFFLTYISFLAISISFFDAHTRLNTRILLPAYLAIVMSGVSLAWFFSFVLNNRLIWYGFILYIFLSVAINSPSAVAVARDINRNGYGYTSRQWTNSETVNRVTTVADDVKIYSNGPDVIQLLTGRMVTMIPNVTDAGTLKQNENYEEQMQLMCRELKEGKAILVYLNRIDRRWYLPTLQEMNTKCVMPILANLNDGIIYGRLKTQTKQDIQ